MNVLVAYPNFTIVVESMALPPQVMAPTNMFILKGAIQTGVATGDEFKVKAIIVPAFPFQAPKVYIDQQLDARIIQ